MKPKNKIKLHKSVEKVIREATAFVNAAIELHKLNSKPIPEYAKGAKDGGLAIVSDGNNGKEIIVTPNYKNVVLSKPLGSYIYSQEHWDEKLKHILNAKDVVYEGGFRSGRTHFYEEWSKQLNEYLKSKGFKNDEPFGMAPIEYKEPKIDLSTVYHVIQNGLKTPIAPPLGFSHDFHKQAIEAEKELDKVCKRDSFEIVTFKVRCIKCGHRHKHVEVDLVEKTTKCENCYCNFAVEIINNKIMITEIN